jgi:hypothetical protein
MNTQRTPYCLCGALAIPAAYIIFLIMGYWHSLHPSSEGGNIGGNDLSGVFTVFVILGGLFLLGLLLTVISLIRKEKWRSLAYACLCLYLLPLLLLAFKFSNFFLPHRAYPSY